MKCLAKVYLPPVLLLSDLSSLSWCLPIYLTVLKANVSLCANQVDVCHDDSEVLLSNSLIEFDGNRDYLLKHEIIFALLHE